MYLDHFWWNYFNRTSNKTHIATIDFCDIITVSVYTLYLPYQKESTIYIIHKTYVNFYILCQFVTCHIHFLFMPSLYICNSAFFIGPFVLALWTTGGPPGPRCVCGPSSNNLRVHSEKRLEALVESLLGLSHK